MDKSTLGRALRRIRKQSDHTLAEVGEAIGVTQTTVSRYERGTRWPDENRLEDILEYLGATRDELDTVAGQIGHSGQQEKRNGQFVQTKDGVETWRDTIVNDPDVGADALIVLMGLPQFVDEHSWLVLVTEEQFRRQTNRDDDTIERGWPEAIGSKYVEPVGEVEWALRLILPEG